MIPFEKIKFHKLITVPKHLLPKELIEKDGSKTIAWTVTEETNGYALFQTVTTYEFRHAEDFDSETKIIDYAQGRVSSNRDLLIEKAVKQSIEQDARFRGEK